MKNKIRILFASVVLVGLLGMVAMPSLAQFGANGVFSLGGSTTQFQFNDAGIFGGAAGLTYTKATTLVNLPLITSDATHTDASICEDTTTHALYSGSGTLGICLGTSSARYKINMQELAVGLPEILALPTKSFNLDSQHGDPTKLMYGFLAEDCVKIVPALTGLDKGGLPNTCDYVGLIPVLVNAIKQQQIAITALQVKLGVSK